MQERDKKKIVTSNSIISKSLSDTERFAEDIAKNAKVNDVFCLIGDLGVGKTVIAKSIGKFFNVEEEMTSPTFNILKSYKTNNKKISKIHHFDLYRIKNINELINIGFEEYLYDNNSIVLIEWPEIANELLPKNLKNITIQKFLNKDNSFNDNERQILYEEYE